MKTAIICVDDEKAVLSGIEQQLIRLLGDKDYILEFAQSGTEALEIIDELMGEDVDIVLIITDQMMPGIKGSELINMLQVRSPKTKCVMLTGYTDHLTDDIHNKNLVKVINKPWNSQELVQVIKENI